MALNAHCMIWELPPKGSQERASVIEQLLIPVQGRKDICQKDIQQCNDNPFLSRGITFDYVNHDWVLDEIWAKLDGIAAMPQFDLLYVGTTGSPLWRW